MILAIQTKKKSVRGLLGMVSSIYKEEVNFFASECCHV